MLAIAIPPSIVAGRRYVFLFNMRAESLAEGMVGEWSRRKYKRIAIISAVHDGRFLLKQATSLLAKEDTFALDEEFLPSERDFRAFLAKFRSVIGVDAIYANLFLGQLGIFARQVRE